MGKSCYPKWFVKTIYYENSIYNLSYFVWFLLMFVLAIRLEEMSRSTWGIVRYSNLWLAMCKVCIVSYTHATASWLSLDSIYSFAMTSKFIAPPTVLMSAIQYQLSCWFAKQSIPFPSVFPLEKGSLVLLSSNQFKLLIINDKHFISITA